MKSWKRIEDSIQTTDIESPSKPNTHLVLVIAAWGSGIPPEQVCVHQPYSELRYSSSYVALIPPSYESFLLNWFFF